MEKDLTADWEGHKPTTSVALLDVMTTAVTGSAKVSRADRVLFTTCEFWASARNRTLFEQLGEDAISQLFRAEAAFIAIGLPKSAGIVHHGRMALTQVDSPGSVQKVAETLEKALAEIDEPVDQMIAEFANALQLARLRTPV